MSKYFRILLTPTVPPETSTFTKTTNNGSSSFFSSQIVTVIVVSPFLLLAALLPFLVICLPKPKGELKKLCFICLIFKCDLFFHISKNMSCFVVQNWGWMFLIKYVASGSQFISQSLTVYDDRF